MSNPARNDYRISLTAKSRGVALLVMLGIILIAFTAVAISRLSLNSGEQKARAKTTLALAQSRDAIMAFALVPANVANAPGRLPCPDINGNGVSDPAPPSAAACPNRRGLVPFVTLGIPRPLDGTGAPIWYVVSLQYTGVAASVTPYNSSSTVSALMLSGNPMAFILLAPNKPLGTQVRTSLSPIAGAFAQFLEGDNANGTLDSYTDVRNDNNFDSVADTQNDQVLGMPMGAFWTSVEGRVLKEVSDRLVEYRNAGCGIGFPWAAPVVSTDNIGLATTFDGRLPLANWNANCTAPVAPTAPAGWVNTHWNTQLYYVICQNVTPSNPPSTPCLELDGDGDNNDAEAIVLSPGVRVLAQTRPVFPAFATVPNLFEGENATTTDNNFLKVKAANHIPNTFNDLIYVVR